MMLERNQLDRELEKAKKLHREQIATLESKLEESEKLSTLSTQLKLNTTAQTSSTLPSPKVSAAVPDHSEIIEQKNSLETANQLLSKRLEESDEQLFKLTTELQLLKSQHARELQDLKLSSQKAITSDEYNKLQTKLDQQARRCQELEEALHVRSTEGSKLLTGEYGF